jgi:hypothetical protein
MSDAHTYRCKAEECRRNAQTASTDIERRLALALAKDFEQKALAEERTASATARAAR